MNKETGGPAFPTGAWEYDGASNVLPYQKDGMTLRDYFAAKAMQGIVANPNAQGLSYEAISMRAFAQADSMLKAREQ